MTDELRQQQLTLTAPAAFWTALRLYARWIIRQAEAPAGYHPRNGAVDAARAFLALYHRKRGKKYPARSLSLFYWSWLARGLYEAEQAQNDMPENLRPGAGGVPKPPLVGRFLAWLLREYWPVWHGLEAVDLRDWVQQACYADWDMP